MTTTLDRTSPTATITETPKNLYQRLAAVRVALGGEIEKKGTAPDAMGRFKFIAWDDVAEKIGGFMADAGVMMVPSERRTAISEAGATANGKTIWRATVWLDLLFVNVDDPTESHSISWCGVGDDTGDKSVQKAITSATKYALLKLFLLSGADDADASDVTASAGAPRPSTARYDGAHSPTTGKGSLCPFCKELGWTSLTNLAPTFWLKDRGPNTGKYVCNGRTDETNERGERGYANHLMPTTDAENEAAADAVPFDYEQP